MKRTVYAAVVEGQPGTYLWKFRKDTRRGMYGAKRVDLTTDGSRAMIRANRDSIERNIATAAQCSSTPMQVVEMQQVAEYDAYAPDHDRAAAHLAEKHGGFVARMGERLAVIVPPTA